MYRSTDAALIRAATYRNKFEPQPWPAAQDNTPADGDQWRDWLNTAWSEGPVAEAIEVASPVLARRLRAIRAGEIEKPRQIRKAGMSLARYLLRMRHRATPFGLFAGVALARFGAETSLRWGDQHEAVARADAVWLSDVITFLESCPELLRRLPVMADNTCLVRDGQLVVPHQQQPQGRGDGPAEVSLRHTRAVDIALSTARSPLPVGILAEKIAAEYPGIPATTVDKLLSELVAHRVLITSLRSPMTITDALGHVTEQLITVRAHTIPEVAEPVRQLYKIQETLARHNRAAPAARSSIRASATAQMTSLSHVVEQPLAVDLRLDCDVVLPLDVARETEQAMEAIVRLSPFPSGPPVWRDYLGRFLERYGPGALVPVQELIDPTRGLGFPAGYRGSLLEKPSPYLTDQDEQLLALVQRATAEGAREVVLTDHDLDRLTVGTPATLPAHTELSFHVQAPTQAALNSGHFRLVVKGLSLGAGTVTGRFLDLIDRTDRDRIATTYSTLPTLTAGALRAQVSSPPLWPRTENVGRAPEVLPAVISLAEHRSGTPLDDLAVRGDVQGLCLVSLSRGQAVEPAVLNAVQLTNVTHPLARFLCELPRARAAVLSPFSWGAASRLPYLPRIRYGRTVLSTARWRVTASDLTDGDSWRARYGMPTTICLGESDQRLHLDLNIESHLQLVRDELDHADHATLYEAPQLTAYGWFGGRAHEITLALASAQAPAPPPPIGPVSSSNGHLPGSSTWAYAKLYAHPDRFTSLLTTHLPRLFETWTDPPEWWFVRYRDPDPHLRLRLRLSGASTFGAISERVAAWAELLRRDGLLSRVEWDTYYPETGRYGTGPTMSAAEAVFAADSAAAVAQLSPEHGLHPQAATAASLVDLATAFTGGTEAGMRWLIGHTDRVPGPTLPRAVLGEALRLTGPGNTPAAVTSAWARRRAALSAYRSQLDSSADHDPDSVLASLLHMHHIRAIGIDEECERECRRLARAAALSWLAQRDGGSP
ncbi:lantibiotic dehydratase [Streptomyces jumonjinensis]|uniref:lantibiotic dehydratase n=1 Tax=Streptomyces jumonjinensis TaxID=1945 RepID=UPI00379B0260